MNTGLPRHLTVSDCPVCDGADVDLDGGERQRRGVGIHLVDERPGHQGRAHRADRAGGDVEEIAAGRFCRSVALCQVASLCLRRAFDSPSATPVAPGSRPRQPELASSRAQSRNCLAAAEAIVQIGERRMRTLSRGCGCRGPSAGRRRRLRASEPKRADCQSRDVLRACPHPPSRRHWQAAGARCARVSPDRESPPR